LKGKEKKTCRGNYKSYREWRGRSNKEWKGRKNKELQGRNYKERKRKETKVRIYKEKGKFIGERRELLEKVKKAVTKYRGRMRYQ
jgi:hypothetical protein